MSKIADFSMFVRNARNAESYAPGAVIFNAGDPGTCMYIVRSGTVEIQVDGAPVGRVEAGNILGEMALVDHEPRSATAVAGTDCEVVPVDEKQFNFMVGQTPFFALSVMRVIASRLRQSNAQSAGQGL